LTSNTLLKLLKRILGNPKREGKNEYAFYCPFCKHHKKKLAANVESGKWHCWVCETSGRSPRTLILRFGTQDDINEYEKVSGVNMTAEVMREMLITGAPVAVDTQEPIELPPEFVTLTRRNMSVYDTMVRNYLINRRGWTHNDLLFWKAGYCRKGDFGGRIIIPSFDATGTVNYFVGRAFLDSLGRKYYNPPSRKGGIIFNELMLDFRREVIISEGVFDCAKLGENSVPLLGSYLNKEDRLFYAVVKNKSPVVLCLDTDARKKTLTVASALLKYGVETYIANLGKHGDAGEIETSEEAKRIIGGAKQITPDNFALWKLQWSI